MVEIKTIDDVLPYLTEGKGIVVSERSNYTVIDYLFVEKDTFDSEMALQCRGLKFDKQGNLIARPFQKFFNLGEKEDPLQMDWSKPHVVMDKLDGSMIHPALLEGELVFMTRMGVTDHAKAALGHASDDLLRLCRDQIEAGWTPMFEYTGPDNRIVVQYDEPQLTLLANREMLSGLYLTHRELAAVADEYGIPVVQTAEPVDDINSFLAAGKALEDVEGYVIAFDDGHRVKLKADAYVLRHRAFSGLHSEKNVLTWILTNAVDDVIPLITPDAAERLLDYQSQVERALSDHATMIDAFVAEQNGKERREFALAAQKSLSKPLCAAAFAVLDGAEARDAVKKHLVWASRSSTRIDAVREVYGFQWSADGLPEPELG